MQLYPALLGLSNERFGSVRSRELCMMRRSRSLLAHVIMVPGTKL